MLRFAIEVAITIALCFLVVTSPLGAQNYVIIGSILAVVGIALIYGTKGFHNNDENVPTPTWFLMTVLLCAGLGAVWPALPVILLYERDKTRRRRAKAVNVVDGNAVTGPDARAPSASEAPRDS